MTRQSINSDKRVCAGNLVSLASVADSSCYCFARADICDRVAAVCSLFAEHQPASNIHLAAESLVDRSMHGPGDFVQTNITGTYTLLEAACGYWSSLTGEVRTRFRFHNLSTDEVFGSLGDTGLITETIPYQPNSLYSAAKATSDHPVRAWHHFYGFPVVTTSCSNNFGLCQFPKKSPPY